MSTVARRAVRLAVAVLACADVLAAMPIPTSLAAAAGVPPPPSSDPFYTPPSGFTADADGTVLRARTVTATAYSVPLPAHAWQLLYRSEDSTGAPTAEVTTVLVPDTAWTGAGARPVVSYQTAEDGVGSQCEPSYVIQAGVLGIESNSESETGIIAGLLTRGWAVVTSDYEGPRSEFLAGRQEGRGVLDGIRAALSYGPDTLGAQNPVALWGYSGGAFASSWAAELQPAYAPGLRLTGMAIGGDPADLVRSFEQVNGGYGFGLEIGGIIGQERAFPDAGIEQMFTPKGQSALASSSADCTDQLIASYAFGQLADYTVSPHPLDGTPLIRVLAADSPLGKGAPRRSVPVYDYHAIPDELVPVAVDDDLVAEYCAAGVPVHEVRYSYGDHNSTLLTGAPAAEQFLADRFAGAAVVNDCPRVAPPLPRKVLLRVGPRRWRARPSTVGIATRPRSSLVRLRWVAWGDTASTATGWFVEARCVAGRHCAKRGRLRARATASGLKLCSIAGQPPTEALAYTRLRYTLTGRLPRGVQRVSLRHLTCPPGA